MTYPGPNFKGLSPLGSHRTSATPALIVRFRQKSQSLRTASVINNGLVCFLIPSAHTGLVSGFPPKSGKTLIFHITSI